MIVWVVEGHFENDGSIVLAVFNSYIKAVQCQIDNEGLSQFGYAAVTITEWEVN